MNVKKYSVDHLKDTGDITLVRNAVQALDGVHAVRVDNVSNTITVEFENNLSEKQILSAINQYKREDKTL
ncbi:MAG: cation transporter [Bacillota bacterium]